MTELSLAKKSEIVLSKKLRVAFARTLIDLYPVGKPFSKNDLIVFSWLVGEAVKSATKALNPKYPKDPRHIIADGESFSWHGRIEGIGGTIKLKRVMRAIIAPDLRDFLSACEPKECAICGSTEDLTTDHDGVPFDTIAQRFIDDHAQIALEKNDNGVGHRFADFALESEWIGYHAANACYQILCRSCNSRKGSRGGDA